MVIVQSLKGILSIKIKSRQDGYTDQFNRLLMTKILLICSVIIAVDYFSDKVTCIQSDKSSLSSSFVHEACWISGFYVYKELEHKMDKSAYYGIPKQIEYDGMTVGGEPCATKNLFHPLYDCTPMTKVYYLHYQYMPFYLGALSVFFYLPYLVFRMVNTDLMSLKASLKDYQGDADNLVRNYFNYNVNSQSQLRLKIWWNIFVKALYVFFSMISFYLTDFLLLGNYITYGKDYIIYAMKNITSRHSMISNRLHVKPGNYLLPSMGFCEIHEATKDTRSTHHNENRLICEISPHILYQYVLMVLWFFFVTSITISVIGLAGYVVGHGYYLLYYGKSSAKKSIHRFLTLREIEYLQFIKRKNMIVYGEITRKLQENRKETQGKSHGGVDTNKDADAPPMYHNGQYFQRKESYMMQHFDNHKFHDEQHKPFARMQSIC